VLRTESDFCGQARKQLANQFIPTNLNKCNKVNNLNNHNSNKVNNLNYHQVFSLVQNSKHLPVEKVRDEDTRMITLRSAAPFAMNDVHVQEFFAKPAEQVSAFAIGLSKNLQQSMR
jgi:hypothetical protein